MCASAPHPHYDFRHDLKFHIVLIEGDFCTQICNGVSAHFVLKCRGVPSQGYVFSLLLERKTKTIQLMLVVVNHNINQIQEIGKRLLSLQLQEIVETLNVDLAFRRLPTYLKLNWRSCETY